MDSPLSFQVTKPQRMTEGSRDGLIFTRFCLVDDLESDEPPKIDNAIGAMSK
jgi:hypothetical protein